MTTRVITDVDDRTDDALDAAAIIDAALAAAVPRPLGDDGRYAVVIPAGGRLEVIDLELEKGEETPRRKHERVQFYTAGSLGHYVSKHDVGDGSAVMFADADKATVVAILNAPTEDAAGWSDHRATLKLRVTPEWARWAKYDGSMLGQVEFAELIEQGIPEIAAPPAAELLELAQTFEAAQSAEFRSATRLDSGERVFAFSETIDARAGRDGQLTIPAEFHLALAPFVGSSPRAVVARLRYRLRDGKLTLGYFLDRPDRVLEAAFEEVLEVLESSTAGVLILDGNPPA